MQKGYNKIATHSNQFIKKIIKNNIKIENRIIK